MQRIVHFADLDSRDSSSYEFDRLANPVVEELETVRKDFEKNLVKVFRPRTTLEDEEGVVPIHLDRKL